MPPITIMIKPASGLCNMRCVYCFYSDVRAHRQVSDYGIMTADTLETLIRRAVICADGVLNLAFQGGEPTLAGKEYFRTLLKLEKKYSNRGLKIQNSIQTNGLVLDGEWIDIFREGRFLVGVSVDGTETIHDRYRIDASGRPTWERVRENIGKLKAAGVDYNVLCVVNGTVARAPEEVFRGLEQHTYMQFIPCLDGFGGTGAEWSLTAEDYGRFLIATYDLYEQRFRTGKPVSIRNFDNWIGMLNGCPPENCALSGRCGNYFLIESDGSVYPCDFYVLDEWKMGNIRETNFKTLSASETGERFRCESLPVPDSCRACPWFNLCRNGCKRDREPLRACDGPAKTRLCASHRAFFTARYDRLCRLAKDIREGKIACL